MRRKLKCETDTPEMEERIYEAFVVSPEREAYPGLEDEHFDIHLTFEYGQWYVLTSLGAVWAVHDASPGIDGFEFERIAEGEEL